MNKLNIVREHVLFVDFGCIPPNHSQRMRRRRQPVQAADDVKKSGFSTTSVEKVASPGRMESKILEDSVFRDQRNTIIFFQLDG